MSELPEGWSKVTVAELGAWVGGGTPSKVNKVFWTNGTIPWVSPKDMKSSVLTDTEDHITPEAVASSAATLVPAGSVLAVTRSGILRRSFPVAVTRVEAALNQDLKALQPAPGISSQYIAWCLRAREQEILRKCSKDGTTVNSIDFPEFLRFPVPLAPLREQERIVAAIEEQFSRLDAGVAALERAKQNLKRMRAAVLQAAVTGSLVPPNPDAESADELVARALEARASALTGSRKSRVPTPVAFEPAGLPSLPASWRWASLDSIAEVVGGVTKDAKTQSAAGLVQVPYLRVANVQRGYLDLTDIATIGVTSHQLDLLRLRPGDVLFNEGGDRDKLGRGWVWSGEIDPCIHQNHVFRARLYADIVDPRFVSWHGNTFGQQWFQAGGKQTTNLASVNKSTLRSFPVPIPPRAEQERIIRAVEEQLAWIDWTSDALGVAEARATRLRSSILSAAFSGELVPQDPSDEPASVLLERIAAERAASDGKRPARKTRQERLAI